MVKSSNFDAYNQNYKDVINNSARLSGEKYEYFAELRLTLLRHEMLVQTGRTDRYAILDFGCGCGDTVKIMNSVFPESSFTGVDESVDSIATAIGLSLPGTTFLTVEKTIIPVRDNSMDITYSNGTFHHIAWGDHPNVFLEITRVTKPGGFVFICENNPLNPFMMHAMRITPFDKGLKAISPARLIKFGEEAGLDFLGTGYYFFFPRILKFMRPLESFIRCVPFGAQYYVLFRKAV